MSSLIAAIVNGVIHRILRVAGSLSYGTLVLPYDEEVVWPAVRARRVPPLLQWAIERDNFESDVVNGYAAMEDGAARQLVAGTGVGKSTVLPYRITSQMGVSGIMLMPNNELPVMCMAHLRTKFVEWGGTVTPVILRTQHATSPLPAPTLYLSSASDFLGRLAKRPSLIQDLGVDFIYLDESHEVRPEYIFFRYAKEAGLFGTVKVFFGTATAAGDLNMESGGVGRSVVAKPVNMFPMSSPRSVSAQSPLHYSNICNRTLVFVATDAEAVAWAEYYDQHDVPVMHYLVEEGAHLLPRIGTHLSQNPLCVLLVPSFFQTGFTLNVDTVIDTGYVSELRMEHENKRMILVKRPVTQAERTQRMGRVGRFKPGRGYYADVEVSRPVSDEAPEVAMYVFLWSRVFNMQINEPTIRDFEQLTGEITPKAAAVLLHSRVHPYLLLPYVANDGFFVGWGKVLKYTLYSSMAIDGDESNADKVQSWAEYGTGPVDYATAPFKYKCAIKFPAEWSVIPAVAWKFFSRDVDDVTLRGLSGRSVISAITARTEVSPARVRRSLRISTPPQSPVLSQYSSATLPAYAGTQTPPPAFTSVEDVSSVSVPSIRELQNAYSVQSVAPALRESTVAPTVREASVAPSRRGVESVSRWRRDVPARTHHRKISGSGSSSNDREEIPLKQVDPAKYMYNKLYPMDPTVFDNYIADEMVTKNDHRRVENLLQGKRDFSSLPDDATSLRGRQETYFISVLRVHNSAVSRKLQLSSNLRPGFIAKITNSFTADLEFEDSRIRSTVRLLKACALQSFFVGVDSRSMHASITSSVVVPSYNEYASRARIMLAFGPPEVMHAVDQLVTAAVPCMDDLGWCAANAWAIDSYVVAVAHSVDEDDESTWPPNAESVHVMDVERDLIVFKSSVTGASPYIRYAKLYEPVYIMYFDAEENRITVIGDFTVVGDGNPIQVDFVLTHGCSGAAVVAVSDGALLGFYRGRYADGVSWVIPSPFVQAHIFGGTE